MAPGIDMLHHFGPLMRSKSTSTHGLLDDNSTKNTFDYGCFRRHFATLFDRIVRLASSSPEGQKTQQKTTTMEQPVEASSSHQAQSVDEIGNMERMLNDKAAPLSRPGKPNLSSSLEAVEDAEEEEEEEEEYDENDLRDTGYRKNYGAPAVGEEQTTTKRSDWVNEDFELPTTEELFSDLGIWW